MMLAALAVSACIAVTGPTITASDLAQAVPGFVPADPGAVVAYSPEPGVDRVFPAGELRSSLSRLGYQTSDPLPAVCFARPVAPVNADGVMAAMHNTIGAAAHIELVELSRTPAPTGEIVFPREGLGVPPVAFWRGYVKYDGEKKFSIWARLKLTVPVTRAIAKEDLKPGVPIHIEQIAMQTEDTFPERRGTAQSAKVLDGLLPRRVIAAGTPVWDDAVQMPADVTKGDRVTVTVRSGRARLSFDAEAQSSARVGESVSLKNLESGKVFQAKVAAKGAAALETLPVTR